MKKMFIGLTVALLTISSFAFTTKAEHPLTNPFWFRTQSDGTVINSNGIPPQQASDPFGCTTGSVGCSKSYTSYKLVSPGVYGPDGTLQDTHMKP